MANLRTVVYVRDEGGRLHRFGPGDDVPGWASKKITNTAAWDDGEAPVAEKSKRKAPTKKPAVEKPAAGSQDDEAPVAETESAQQAADRQAAQADADAAETAPGAGGSE